MRLAGKVAFIGGAGARMGRAVPLLFAQEGAKIAMAARTASNLDTTLQQIRDTGGDAITITADMTEEGDVARAIAATVEAFGRLDVLYNNAGGFAPRQTDIVGMEADFWDQATRNNLRSVFLSCKHAVPEMGKNGGGSIINVAAGYRTRQEGNVAYGAAKSGVIGFTRNLAGALWEKNIRVNCIAPGLMWRPLAEGPVRPAPSDLSRRGAPEDAGFAAVYFASDESAWVTGQVLAIDGGDEVRFLNEYTRPRPK